MIRTPSVRRNRTPSRLFATSTPFQPIHEGTNRFNFDPLFTPPQSISLSPLSSEETRMMRSIEETPKKVHRKDTESSPSVIHKELQVAPKKTSNVLERQETPVGRVSGTSRTHINVNIKPKLVLAARKPAPVTYPQTPKYARPTKAWIARSASKLESPEVERPRSSLSREEKEQVWHRLYQAKPISLVKLC